MRELTVYFRSVTDIADFVMIANRQPFPVEIVHGDCAFDAKSLLSLFCLEFNAPMTVRVPDVEADISRFCAELQGLMQELQPA